MKNKPFLCTALICTALFASAANADMRTPALPGAVKLECTSCHTAFPAGTMSRANWAAVTGSLGKHYGTDASVSAADLHIIQTFFADNASTRSDKHHSPTTPPRVTNTPWFQKEHRKVPNGVWTDARVKSVNNCAACHTQADKGSFAERDIVVPGYEGRRW